MPRAATATNRRFSKEDAKDVIRVRFLGELDLEVPTAWRDLKRRVVGAPSRADLEAAVRDWAVRWCLGTWAEPDALERVQRRSDWRGPASRRGRSTGATE